MAKDDKIKRDVYLAPSVRVLKLATTVLLPVASGNGSTTPLKNQTPVNPDEKSDEGITW